MPPASTETDNYKLLFYLINQLEKKDLINKNINWDEVAAALNAKVGTVQKRWQVLKKKEHIGQDDALLDADDEEEDDAKPKKPATRKVCSYHTPHVLLFFSQRLHMGSFEECHS